MDACAAELLLPIPLLLSPLAHSVPLQRVILADMKCSRKQNGSFQYIVTNFTNPREEFISAVCWDVQQTPSLVLASAAIWSPCCCRHDL